MNKYKHKNNIEKIHKSYEEHKDFDGYMDINNSINKIHEVLSSNPYTEISKSHKYI